MEENKILEIFYKKLDNSKIEDINSFLSVRRINVFTELLQKRYKRINKIISNEYIDNLKINELKEDEQQQIKEMLYKLKDEWEKIDEFKKILDGAFFDIQEYYFMQGFKANTELREQLQRLIDKN